MRDDLVTPAQAAALRFAEILTDYPRGLEIEARDEAGKYFTPEAARCARRGRRGDQRVEQDHSRLGVAVYQGLLLPVCTNFARHRVVPDVGPPGHALRPVCQARSLAFRGTLTQAPGPHAGRWSGGPRCPPGYMLTAGASPHQLISEEGDLAWHASWFSGPVSPDILQLCTSRSGWARRTTSSSSPPTATTTGSHPTSGWVWAR